MKTNIKSICALIFLSLYMSESGNAQSHLLEGVSKNYLTLTPDLKAATLINGRAKIPFTIKNNYTEDILLVKTRNAIDALLTLNDSGEECFVESFPSSNPGRVRGGYSSQVVLKPGESRIYYADYSMEMLNAIGNRQVFGAITGRVVSTEEMFQSFSAPFFVPQELKSPPWVDLGMQTYLSVTVDLNNSQVYGGNITEMAVLGQTDLAERTKGRWAEKLQISIKVKNTTGLEYIAAHVWVNLASSQGSSPSPWEIKRLSPWGINRPSPWEALQGEGKVVKPGQSADFDAILHLKQLEYEGYKTGDKMVAVVGGRIPNTNQIFACSSEPFELPPLPACHPPK